MTYILGAIALFFVLCMLCCALIMITDTVKVDPMYGAPHIKDLD